MGACSTGGAALPAGRSTGVTSTAAPSTTAAPVSTTAAPVSTDATSTTVPASVYVFPFVGVPVSYGTTHHDYPAVDVFGCGATVVAPTDGVVQQTREVDLWDPAIDEPANRGGKYVSMVGRDGVRYYFAHLDSVAVMPGQAVQPGDALGVMGQTGNARNSACHTHVGLSWACPTNEWAVRRGEVWPSPYLDAWRNGEQRSPTLEVLAAELADPEACSKAATEPGAADA